MESCFISIQDGENEVENEGEGEVDVEGERGGEGDVESEAELHERYPDQGESEGERVQSSPEREVSDQRLESEGKDEESEDHGYGQRVVTSRRREVVASDSEISEDNHYAGNEDEEVDQAVKPRYSSSLTDINAGYLLGM